MTTLYQSRRRTVQIARLPKRPLVRRLEQAEDPQPTEEESRIVFQFIIEHAFMPIQRGEVSIRDSITPAGGWARFDAAYPDFDSLPVSKQLALVLKFPSPKPSSTN